MQQYKIDLSIVYETKTLRNILSSNVLISQLLYEVV